MTATAGRLAEALPSWTAYDEAPYLSHVYPQAHPDRLATHATLLGVPCAPVETCRTLEIGCGDAVNLISLAYTHPKARFVGIDLASTAIARGQAMIDALGLNNINLVQADILDADPGEFDYILAHGVYAWIPPAAREAMLAMIRRALAPAGVAFVSYNALPGCRVRQVVRDMLRFALKGVEGVSARAEAARDVLREIAEDLPGESPFHTAVREEANDTRARPLSLVAHDELSDDYHPVHLFEFVDHCARHGLAFLTEAEPRNSAAGFLPPHALDDPDFDVIARAQHADFALLRCFHQTLVVRDDLVFSRRPRPENLYGLHAATPATLNEKGVFETSQMTFEIEDETTSAAIRRLGRAWPKTLPVRELIGGDAVRAEALLNMYWAGAVALHAEPSTYVTTPGERPEASALARLQARSGTGRLVTLRHATVEFQDDFSREFIGGLDGTRTVEEIVRDVCARLDGPPDKIDHEVRTNLVAMAEMSLLVR